MLLYSPGSSPSSFFLVASSASTRAFDTELEYIQSTSESSTDPEMIDGDRAVDQVLEGRFEVCQIYVSDLP